MNFATKFLALPYLPQGFRSHYEKLLHERHWIIGRNSCNEGSTAPERRALLTCSHCSSSDRSEVDTFDHVFRLCPSPLLQQSRVTMNVQMDQHVLSTDLDKRLVPQLIQLVLSPDGHRICLGNWNTVQLTSLSSVLLPTDSSEAIYAVLLDLSRKLIPWINAVWEARKRRNLSRPWRTGWRLARLPSALYNASINRFPSAHQRTQSVLRRSSRSRSGLGVYTC